MLISGGRYLKSPTITRWAGRTDQWPDWLSSGLGRWTDYAALYSSQMWVNTVIDKRARAQARLPLKVYERGGSKEGRIDAAESPYGLLLGRPSNLLHPYMFWTWVQTTRDIHGEAFLGKVRDSFGRPVELVPLHPVYVKCEYRASAGRVVWWYESPGLTIPDIARRDLVHFRNFHSGSVLRGQSKLEPLRSTLENEYNTRQANSALWKHGGKPSIALEHPGELSDPALQRLSAQWTEIHAGVQNWAKALILEEGMKANVLPLNNDELQYIETRRLNREEVVAAYDMPPAAVHILDRATFSNITENLRSVYRDTMGPILADNESVLEFELRDGRFDEIDREPDFGDLYYAEWLLDGVLRGDFEARQSAYKLADYMTLAEKRERENLPFVPGSDRIFVNSTMQPLNPDGTIGGAAEPEPEPEPEVDPEDEILDVESEEVPPALPPAPTDAVRSLMGRVSRAKTVGEIDWSKLLSGMSTDLCNKVLIAADDLRPQDPIELLRQRLRQL